MSKLKPMSRARLLHKHIRMSIHTHTLAQTSTNIEMNRATHTAWIFSANSYTYGSSSCASIGAATATIAAPVQKFNALIRSVILI